MYKYLSWQQCEKLHQTYGLIARLKKQLNFIFQFSKILKLDELPGMVEKDIKFMEGLKEL